MTNQQHKQLQIPQPTTYQHPNLNLYKQISFLFKKITPNNYAHSYQQINSKVVSISKNQPQICESIMLHLQTVNPVGGRKQSKGSEQEMSVSDYWVACSINEQSQWKYIECLSKGSKLLSLPTSQLTSLPSINKCRPFILLNTLVSKYKLGMYQQALKLANQLIKSATLSTYAKEVKICTLIKMGITITQQDKCKDAEEGASESMKSRRKYSQDLQTIMTMDKTKISHLLKQQNTFHISNWYNLALLCKNKNFTNESILILEALLQHNKAQHLKDKCCVLLSQIYEYKSSYTSAIKYLEQLPKTNEVSIKIWELKSKLQLQSANKQLISDALMKDARYKMLQNLQQKLSSLYTRLPMKKTIKSKENLSGFSFSNSKIVSNQLSTKRLPTCKKYEKKPSLKALPTFKRISKNIRARKYSNHPPSVPPNPSQLPLDMNKPLPQASNDQLVQFASVATCFMTKESLLSQQTVKEQKQKGVRFDLSSDSQASSSMTLIGEASAYEEKIITHIIDSRFEDALDQIKNAQNCLEELEAQDKSLALNFTLKLSKWCRQAGKERYAILLIRKVMDRIQEDHHSYKALLKELSRNYQDLKEYKNAIEVGLQLIRLGETEYLDRLGQLHMLRQNYNQALKCYEKYHDIRGDIYSIVKLAHAYSKIPSYSKIAIELLNQILFQNKTMCIFKIPQTDQAQDFQSALLLLATIYMNLNGQKKAMEICERYLQKDFGAYPIFYILGILKLRQGYNNQAFNCFLSAIRIKPNHLPSLIELLKFLKTNSFEVLSVLRKAFLMHHRDWQLLQLLVQAATKAQTNYSQLSVQGLIKCANSLQQVCEDEDLHLQTEAVWMWAAQLIDQKQKRMSIIDNELIYGVYLRLGNICLNKGDYPNSERYFLRVLQKAQLESSRTMSKSTPQKINRQLLILRNLAFLKTEQKEYDMAINYLSQSRNIALRNGMTMEAVNDGTAIAKMHSLLGQFRQSLAQYTKCVAILQEINLVSGKQQKQFSQWQKIQLRIGECYQNMNLWKEAKKVYQQILRHRINEQATKRLAAIYSKQGHGHLAKELLEGLQAIKAVQQI